MTMSCRKIWKSRIDHRSCRGSRGSVEKQTRASSNFDAIL